MDDPKKFSKHKKSKKKITKHRKAQKDLYHTLRDPEATPLKKINKTRKKEQKEDEIMYTDSMNVETISFARFSVDVLVVR